MIEIRNTIAHTGRFKVLGVEDENAAMLNSAILGLQIIILSKLGHEGDIIRRFAGVVNAQSIKDFLN
ncbi:MAG: hypothetical protein QE487_16210 [Fluviicola sp.]|nr:hypothetical protein [Fluviicola sp.]